MISSSLMAAISMALLGSLLRWSWAPEWAIPLTIVIYCIFFQIGVINVPFIQVGECVCPQVNLISCLIHHSYIYLLQKTADSLISVFR